MPGPAHSGLFIYAKDLGRVAAFYERVLGMSRLTDTEEIVVLESQTVQLVVHAIPPQFASAIEISSPPRPRENTALKFFFTVPNIAALHDAATALGGQVYPDRWQGPGFSACNACDPEGNIFQLREFGI